MQHDRPSADSRPCPHPEVTQYDPTFVDVDLRDVLHAAPSGCGDCIVLVVIASDEMLVAIQFREIALRRAVSADAEVTDDPDFIDIANDGVPTVDERAIHSSNI
jgi:hypothetical protein